MSESTTPQSQEKDSLPTPVQSASDAPESISMTSIKRFLMQEVDSSRAAAPLTVYCFMTGFIPVTPSR
ncbi:hypothetical protein SCLCIDRAFT_1212907 [Scleroderma citrinum Foug A]|uniref:Uncharacterized protein n=1 Tax=Scleroderma citrinum Foug A TaxID=1036808 RepID=A0A0C3EA05_9AGAM|nr:hypothetical protein SCLCIDRAFT_1212907 [Scleroderma citrinum Foug A]